MNNINNCPLTEAVEEILLAMQSKAGMGKVSFKDGCTILVEQVMTLPFEGEGSGKRLHL